MSSRKEVENHNMFESEEIDSQKKSKEVQPTEYAINEQMTIPNFDNKISKDSGWNQRKVTR